MADEGLVIRITLDGVENVFRYNDVTAVDVRDCRKETGFSVVKLMGLAGDSDVDLDTFAALVWLARRQAGERTASYGAIAAKIHPNSDLQVEVVVPETGEKPDPE